MRILFKRLSASLVTRLSLVVCGLLVLSLLLAAGVFLAQSQVTGQRAAVTLLQRADRLAIRRAVFVSLLNAPSNRPLELVRPSALGVDRILLTAWPRGRVVADTAIGARDRGLVVGRATGGPTFTVVGDQTYASIVLPAYFSELPSASPYRGIVVLVHVGSLGDEIARLAPNLAVASAIALVVSSLVAIVTLRRVLRPLRAVTGAVDRMAAGDYDQQVRVSRQDEIGRLAGAFNRMAREVRDAREGQRRFIGNISHDLRSPLTSIIGFSESLAEDATIDARARRAAEIVHREAGRLQRLTLDLLDLSHLEAGRVRFADEPVDVMGVLHEIAHRYTVLPRRGGITFESTVPDGPVIVRGDHDRLVQIITNILDNAIAYCRAGGGVRLAARRDHGAVAIEVTNTADPVPRAELDRLFDRFYRGDHARSERTGGTGLGLAIVRELVHAHHGTVEAASVGDAITFSVRLPVAAADDDKAFTKPLPPDDVTATDETV